MISREAAVIFFQRAWQAFAGLVTVVLIAKYLTPHQQGWYYAFTSLAAFFSIFELGLSSAILQGSLLYFHQEKLSGIGIKPVKTVVTAEFLSYIRKAIIEYSKVIAIYLTSMVVMGFIYFHLKSIQGDSMDWEVPWIFLIGATSCSLLSFPFLSVLEGVGQIIEVYTVRLLQGIFGSLACWSAIVGGGVLWATVAGPILAIVVTITWLMWLRFDLINQIIKLKDSIVFNWESKVRPLQRKIAISWIGAYLMSQLATPILFYACDPVVAGQMGLSLTIAHMIGHLAQVSIVKTIPNISKAVHNKNWIIFDTLIRKGLIDLVIIFILIVSLMGAGYRTFLPTDYIGRLLPQEELFKLAIFVLLYQACAALTAHLRAFNREPLAWVYALGAFITILGSILVASTDKSAGVVDVMLYTQAIIVFPLSFVIWKHCIVSWKKT